MAYKVLAGESKMEESKHNLMKEEGHWNHTGSEDRRKEERRVASDRREMIRFELDKEDRRNYDHSDRRGKATTWGSDKPV